MSVLAVFVAVLLMFSMAGCSATLDEQSAIKKIERKLDFKYEGAFKVIDIQETSDDSGGKSWKAIVTSVDSAVFFEATYSQGKLTDNYKEAGEYSPYEAKIHEITARYDDYEVGDSQIDYNSAYGYWSDISNFDNSLNDTENISGEFNLLVSTDDIRSEADVLYAYFQELHDTNIFIKIHVLFEGDFGLKKITFFPEEQSDTECINNRIDNAAAEAELQRNTYDTIAKDPESELTTDRKNDKSLQEALDETT